MEAIITVVGFLGAGKTTLLKHLISNFIDKGWNPFLILNDYENAYLDTQQFSNLIKPKWLKALNGSCICCSGIEELRNSVNRVPIRNHGITFIEANGTSDACSLMEFLGVGIDDRFLPPIQISVVDVKNWQLRKELTQNELEANQIQVSSLIVLTHLEKESLSRKKIVIAEIKAINPLAKITTVEELDSLLLPTLNPSVNKAQKLEHLKAHWSSCSIDLPTLPNINSIHNILNKIPLEILRVKGCTQIDKEENYTFFERKPDGEIHIRPFNGVPITGAKLLTVGPGSTTKFLTKVVNESII